MRNGGFEVGLQRSKFRWLRSEAGHERPALPCPKCPVSDGRPEKGGLSLRAMSRHRRRPFLSELLGQFGGLLCAGINHVDRVAIPCMFERKCHVLNRFKSSLVAVPSNECDKRLLDVERGP
jgi:hypothetical protein